MFKDDEVKLLDKVIKQFGPNSYLGPWLAEHRDTLVGDIRLDLPPSVPLPNEARRLGETLLAKAQIEAAAIVSAANKSANEYRERETKRVSQYLDDARKSIGSAASKLEHLIDQF